jgi:pyrroloquinoline quinone (PQQ) biosynthesis protein C
VQRWRALGGLAWMHLWKRTAEDDGYDSSRVQNRQSSQADRFALQTLRNATFGAEAVV